MAKIDVKIEDYPGNSFSDKKSSEKPKVEKIIQGEVITRKPTLGSKLKKVFLGDNALDIVDYISKDILIPAFQNLILDIVNNSLEMRFFGTTRNRRKGSSYGYTSYETMNRSSRDNRRAVRYDAPKRAFDEVILESSYEAEEVLSHMCELIDIYGMVSIAELNGFIGRSISAVDHNWGWRELGSAKVKRIPEGYLVDFPRVVNLND